MPPQEEHDKPENLVEQNPELEQRAARSLEEAAASHQSLQGYAAINNVRDPEIIDADATLRNDDAKQVKENAKGQAGR